jgi:hypothetical protein
MHCPDSVLILSLLFPLSFLSMFRPFFRVIAMILRKYLLYQLTTSSLDALALQLSPSWTQAALLALVALVRHPHDPPSIFNIQSSSRADRRLEVDIACGSAAACVRLVSFGRLRERASARRPPFTVTASLLLRYRCGTGAL